MSALIGPGPASGRPDWVAVHAAIQVEMFWDTIEQLRELGASEILVTPIGSVIM